MDVDKTAEMLEEIELAVEEGEEQESSLTSSIGSSIYETVTWSTDWTTETIYNQIKRKNIDLSPAFQRRDAWNQAKKCRFIESLFLGLPIPQLVLAEDKINKGKFIVVDGKQRLSTIYQYMSDDLLIKDTSLDAINNKKYSDLQRENVSDADYLQNQTIRSVILKNWRSENLLYSVFYRLNSGSLPLSPQELRAALKPGPIMGVIADYALSSKGIKKIFNSKKPDPRMRDVELILRFISFNMFIDDYDGNFKDFMDKTCDYFNSDWVNRQHEFKVQCLAFEESIDNTTKVFERYSFKRYNSKKWESRFSRAVFDIQTYCLNKPGVKDCIDRHKDDIKDCFVELCKNDPNFLKAITANTNNVQNTLTRFVLFANEIERITGLREIVSPSLRASYEQKYADQNQN